MQNKDYDDHLQNLQELVQKYEQSRKDDLPIYFGESDLEDIVEYYIDNQLFEKAMIVADEAIEQHRYSPTFYMKKAEILIELGGFEEAWDLLENAGSLAPNDVAVLLHKADVKTNQGEYAVAIELVQRALENADKDERGDLLLELADIYEEWEKYYEVIDCLHECLELDSNNEEALNRLWFCVELTEKYEESMHFHKKMVDNYPYNELLWYNLGHAYNGLKQYDSAIEAFEFVIAIDDSYEPAYVDLASILYKTADYKKAIAYFKSAIEKGAPKKELYYNIGKCYDKLNDAAKARKYYKKCITIDPYYAKAFHKIGKGYMKIEMAQNALNPLERAIKLDSNNTEYLKSMASAYVKNEQLDEALDLYQKIIDMNHLDKAIHLHYISALYERGRIGDAIEHLDKTIEIFDEDYSLFYIKTAFLIEIGNRSEAIDVLTQALHYIPESVHQLFEMMPELTEDNEILQIIEQFKG